MHAPSLYRGCLIAAVVTASGLAGCGLEQTELAVRVLDATSGAPIDGASVEVDGFRRERTNRLGVARFMLRSGAYTVDVSAPRYEKITNTVSVFTGMASSAEVRLERQAAPTPGSSTQPSPTPTPAPGASTAPTPKPSASAPAAETVTLYGKVTDPTGARVKGATIYVESNWGIPFGEPATTNGQGEYKLQAKVPRGTGVRVSAMAEGFVAKSRQVTPKGEWRLDFAGAFALSPDVTEPDLPAEVRVSGQLEDTTGKALRFAVVKVESEDMRYPFSRKVPAFLGRFELKVPTRLPLRFTASAEGHRTVTFVETVKSSSPRFDFTGYRALDPKPALE